MTLAASCRLRDLLEHLFVLLPVLDDDKHYWVGADEVDKLLRRGGAWLGTHPERELIARRYLRHDRRLTSDALARLLAEDDDPETRPPSAPQPVSSSTSTTSRARRPPPHGGRSSPAKVVREWS